MKVTVIPIEIDAFGHQRIGSETCKEDDKWRASKLKHFWDRQGYRKGFWRVVKTCCPSDSSENPLANTGVKNSQKSKKNNNNFQRNFKFTFICAGWEK